jgi:transaldolase
MGDGKGISDIVTKLVRDGFVHEFGKPKVATKSAPLWERVRQTGSRLWLDTGDIDEAMNLWSSEFEALTTNNTLLNREVQKGIYDDLIRKAADAIREAAPQIDERDLVIEIAFVLNAYHGLRLVERFDAHVSVELHTDLAGDVDRTVTYGKRFYAICPERFFVKVPLTSAGFLAARRLGEEGVPVNFTLGFSARQNYLAALLSRPCYVNVFMGRLNSFVADRKLGDGRNMGEKATLATQRQIVALRKAGKTETMLIGASMRAGFQVAALAGVDVLTMPPKVAAEYREDPGSGVSSQIETDPSVTLAPGFGFDDFNGTTLWDVPEAFKAVVDGLLGKEVDTLAPQDLEAYFGGAGFGDFLPEWTQGDHKAIAKDGKIPVYERWKDSLSSKNIGMDALMTLSGLHSFATDQKALDDRITSLI